MKEEEQKQNEENQKMISRRKALKMMAIGGATIVGGYYSLKNNNLYAQAMPLMQSVADGEMAKRKNWNNNDKISLLGFGCMRFPQKGREINEELTQEMVDYAYKHGVNYFDTAYPYHGGKSEVVIGKILKNYPRNTFFLADKMPTWNISDLQSAKNLFQEQLDRCQVEYFDYYLLHALGNPDDFEKKYIANGALDYLREEKKKGRIHNLGFSYHGNVEFFEQLITKYQWDFVQIQYNYMDVNDPRQQSGRLLELLAENKLQAVIMEPLKGGTLAKLSKGCLNLLQQSGSNNSAASWALRYAATPDNVLTVLSGMSAMDHVVDNVKSVTGFKPISSKEEQLLFTVATAFKENKPIDCSKCNYCMPCKYGVDIPGIFAVYNDCVNDLDMPNPQGEHNSEYNRKKKKFLNMYNNKIPSKAQADHCIACDECRPKCTQHIRISREMTNINNIVKELKKNK